MNRWQYGDYADLFFFSQIKIVLAMVIEKSRNMALIDESFDKLKSIQASLMKIRV